jgi:hypothetical protein
VKKKGCFLFAAKKFRNSGLGFASSESKGDAAPSVVKDRIAGERSRAGDLLLRTTACVPG